MYTKYIEDNANFKCALYIRLSREDGDDLESESVSNQRILLHDFLKKNNFLFIEEYVDDGYSGGNFNRPAFKRMIKDLENGKINCVITKDLSRLGRDYIDTGRYIERYFPEHNIRYIAVNDDIDTFDENKSGDMMPFKLSMNDMYAKDISKKVRSTLYAMKKDGQFCGSLPSYGYKKDPNDKHRLIPDPETAPVVKRIFALYIEGYGTMKIAQILTEEKIKTPVEVKNYKKELDKANYPHIWKDSSVNNILKNRVYTGCLIQHTTQNINYKTKKRRPLPESEWCIVENTHEAIIDKKTFELARSIRNKSNYYDPNHVKNKYVLKDLVFCKDCGARMSISNDKTRNRIIMNCNNYRKFSKYHICTSKFINYNKFEKAIFSTIRDMSFKYHNNKEEFEMILKKEYKDPKIEIENNISSCHATINTLRRKQDSLYDDKFNGLIDASVYKRLFDKTKKEIEEEHKKIIKYKKELDALSHSGKEYDKAIDIIKNFLDIKNPTKEMMHKIIDKIYITKDKKIEVYYKIKKEEILN